MAKSNYPRYSSIQITHKSQEVLKKKKRDNESYEEYLRRKGIL